MGSSLWFVLCGLGALWLRVGMAVHLTGMLRSKNSSGGVLRSAVDAGLAVLAFWAFGAAIVEGPGYSLAWGRFFGSFEGGGGARLFFLLTVAIISPGIVVGVVAERSKFFPMCAASVLLGGVLVPLTLRWQWGGWLDELGFHDFAAAGPVHLAGAACAVVAARLVGPRMNKYNRDGSSNAIPGHSVPFASVGAVLLFAAWLPAVVGFAARFPTSLSGFGFREDLAARVAANTLLAGAAGAVASVVLSQVRYGKPDIHLTFAGMLGALVSITAIADAPSAWMAVLTGVVAGLIVPVLLLILDLIWKIDDTTGGVAIHGVGAVWGLLAAGFFAPVGSFSQRLKLIGIQLLGIIAIVALATILSAVVFLLLKRTVGLRSKEADEFDGLDLAEHDIGAYPDFQQTTIKSYHLREA